MRVYIHDFGIRITCNADCEEMVKKKKAICRDRVSIYMHSFAYSLFFFFCVNIILLCGFWPWSVWCISVYSSLIIIFLLKSWFFLFWNGMIGTFLLNIVQTRERERERLLRILSFFFYNKAIMQVHIYVRMK